MKNLMILTGVIFLLSIACQKEQLIEEPMDLDPIGIEAKVDENNLALFMKPGKMIPLKGEIYEIGDGDQLECYGIPYFSKYLDIGGQVTHLGNVEGGFVELLNCRLEIRDEIPTIIVDAIGEMAAANGDAIHYGGELTIIFVDNIPIVNNINSITGGTGRWKNATGYFEATFEPQENGILKVLVSGEVSSPGTNNR